MKWVNSHRKNEVFASTLKCGRFNVVVHHHIDYPPAVWLTTCHGLYSHVQLKSQSLDDAKAEALAGLKQLLETTVSELDSVLDTQAIIA